MSLPIPPGPSRGLRVVGTIHANRRQFQSEVEAAVGVGILMIVLPLLAVVALWALCSGGGAGSAAPHQRRGRGSTQVRSSDEVLKELREKERLGLIY